MRGSGGRAAAFGLAALTATTMLAGVTAAPPAGAATCTTSWLLPLSGAWTDGERWSDGVPDASDVACLTVPGAGYTVTLSTDVAVQELEVGAGATLVLEGDAGLTAGVDNGPFSSPTGGLTNRGVVDLGSDGDIGGGAFTQESGGRLDVTLAATGGHAGLFATAVAGGTVRVTVPAPLPPRSAIAIFGCYCPAYEGSIVSPPPVTVVGDQELRLSFGFIGGLRALTPRIPEDRFVQAAYHALLGNAPARPEEVDDVDELVAGTVTRARIARTLSDHTGHWTHETLRLYQEILRRVVVAQEDTEYWVRALRRGDTTLERAAASMYASAEYHQRAGGTTTAWIDALYADVLGRAPSSADRTFWAGEVARLGGRGTVALRITQTPEARRRLAGQTFERILLRPASASERQYWGERIGTHGLNDMLARVVGSAEFDALARQRWAYT